MLFLGYVTSCICRTHEHPNLRKNWRALTLQMFPQYTVYILIILCWVHPLPTNRQVAIPLLTLPLAFFQDKRRRRLLEYNIAKRGDSCFFLLMGGGLGSTECRAIWNWNNLPWILMICLHLSIKFMTIILDISLVAPILSDFGGTSRDFGAKFSCVCLRPL